MHNGEINYVRNRCVGFRMKFVIIFKREYRTKTRTFEFDCCHLVGIARSSQSSKFDRVAIKENNQRHPFQEWDQNTRELIKSRQSLLRKNFNLDTNLPNKISYTKC